MKIKIKFKDPDAIYDIINDIDLPKTCFERNRPLNDFSAALAVARKHADINNLACGDGCATMED